MAALKELQGLQELVCNGYKFQLLNRILQNPTATACTIQSQQQQIAIQVLPQETDQGLLQPAERTQKEKNIGANDFPAQTDAPQAASQVSALL